MEIAVKFGLIHHLKSLTRPAAGRTLDLVLSTTSNLIQGCHVIPGISDHDAILFEVDVAPKFAPKPPRRVYQFHKGEYEGLRAHLSSFCDQSLASGPKERSVEDNWSIIADSIQEVINKFIPSKMTKTKRHLPWVSPDIKRLMNNRGRLHKKAKRTGKARQIGAYRQLRNRITKSIRDSRAKYVKEVMGSIASSPDGSTCAGIKRAWSYIKLLRSESIGISALFWNNRACANNVSKAEALPEQYKSVFTCEDLNNIPVLPESSYQNIPDVTFFVNGIQKLFVHQT